MYVFIRGSSKVTFVFEVATPQLKQDWLLDLRSARLALGE